jgi:4-amino-4-deoxy-L-arabinose transferase-like glycosyltransferase
VNWGFANNLLDNLLAVFSLAAVLLVVMAYDRPSPAISTRRLALIATAGLAICLSLMTKGPVGLFPLAAPAIYWLVFRRPPFLVVVLDSIIILAVIVLFATALYTFEASREAVNRYVSAQLVSSLSGGRGHYGGGLYVFRKILGVNGYSLAILAFAALASWRFRLGRSDSLTRSQRLKRAAFLILIGMSASLPIGLSPRVANFYFNTSLLFYSAGFAILVSPTIMEALSRLKARQAKTFSKGALVLLMASIVIVIANIGRLGSDGRTIEQAVAIEGLVCADEANCTPSISACANAWQDWALHTYMQRFYKISIAKEADVDAEYVIGEASCGDVSGYRHTQTDIAPYVLMKRQS